MSHPQVGRFRDVHIELPKHGVGLSGHYRMEAFQAWEDSKGNFLMEKPGTRRLLAEFDNLVTNKGLDHIGNRVEYLAYCHVGTGTATEVATDTALGTFKAGVAKFAPFALIHWAQGTPPYYGAWQEQYRFSPNFGPGNISIAEVGISTQITTGNLFSRARVKDGGGNPTTVAVLSTEYLDVWYTLRNYPDHVNYTTGATDDGTGTFSVSGTSYSYTVRCSEVTLSKNWGLMAYGSGFNVYQDPSTLDTDHWKSYGTGAVLGAVTGVPTGATAVSGGASSTLGTYSNSTYQNTLTHNLLTSQGNSTGGIKCFVTRNSLGTYQVSTTVAIPKTGSLALDFTTRTTWFNKTLP
jgi:hypothetical protein